MIFFLIFGYSIVCEHFSLFVNMLNNIIIQLMMISFVEPCHCSIVYALDFFFARFGFYVIFARYGFVPVASSIATVLQTNMHSDSINCVPSSRRQTLSTSDCHRANTNITSFICSY